MDKQMFKNIDLGNECVAFFKCEAYNQIKNIVYGFDCTSSNDINNLNKIMLSFARIVGIVDNTELTNYNVSHEEL